MDVTNDQIIEGYERVPRPIREFLSNSGVGAVAKTLAEKYKLHIDASATLADVITKTLLGFIPPAELQQMLTRRLLLEETMATALITDINNLIFIPLQQKVREATEEEKREEELERELRESSPEEPPEPVPVAPVKPKPVPPPALDYLPNAPQITLPGSPVPAPMPEPVAPPPAPTQMPVAPTTETPQVVPVQAYHPPTHPPPAGWHPAAAVHIFVPTQTNHINHPVSVPVAPIQSPEPVMPQPQPAPIQEPAPVVPQESAPLAKNYVADPYRESI